MSYPNQRAYHGESADEWYHITCPDDVLPREQPEREYDSYDDENWGKRSQPDSAKENHE